MSAKARVEFTLSELRTVRSAIAAVYKSVRDEPTDDEFTVTAKAMTIGELHDIYETVDAAIRRQEKKRR